MTNVRPDHDCYFCRVAAGLTDPFIFENRSFLGIFDTNPVNPGHALIIPRRHVVSLTLFPYTTLFRSRKSVV